MVQTKKDLENNEGLKEVIYNSLDLQFERLNTINQKISKLNTEINDLKSNKGV